jgi:hypothetical protein
MHSFSYEISEETFVIRMSLKNTMNTANAKKIINNKEMLIVIYIGNKNQMAVLYNYCPIKTCLFICSGIQM